MLRSAATRVGVSGARALSTNSSGAPPPSGGRFVRRATPLLLTGGTAGFVYKVATDDGTCLQFVRKTDREYYVLRYGGMDLVIECGL